ncbi:MAG: ATP phosphoribosyltransferase regulatory subunit [Lachnospiraceae bacterium]
MKRELLHTPEGVRDIYNRECEQKMVLQNELLTILKQYGYHMIQTPSFEFFDIFGREIGTTPSNELFKFFDHEGNTLVLRPDITPSIARATAKYFMDEEMPIRLGYMGNVFINHKSYQGRLKENTQLGAELINDSSVEADAEIIALAVDALRACGLQEFQVSVGHAAFFEGLAAAAGLDEEQEDELRELIQNKNFFGVEEFVSTLQLDENLQKLFGLLSGFYDTTDEIAQAKGYAKQYPQVLAAIEHLEQLHERLKYYEIDRYVAFELGLVSDRRYYTGIIFSGYTFGSGAPILVGGRYDKLLAQFKKQAPSIGFAVMVDQVMIALSRQKIDIPVKEDTQLVLYSADTMEKAVAFAKAERAKQHNIELMKKEASRTAADYEAYAARNHIAKIIDMDGE